MVSDEIWEGYYSARKKAEVMVLPNNLEGKVVVELYSGENGESIGEEVRCRGGRYVSVDCRAKNSEDVHFDRRVKETLKGFSDESADYVVAFSPPWWRMKKEDEFGSILNPVSGVLEVVRESMRVLKREKGSLLCIGWGFSQRDFEYLRNRLGGRVERSWKLEWLEIPETGKNQSGENTGMVMIKPKAGF